jgi:2-oxoglutarate dehydrogenase E2 component (dihydrolipoamide succinyltransferase)
VKRTGSRVDIGSVQMSPNDGARVMPAAARVLGEAGVAASAATGTGPGGRVTKEDAIGAVAAAKAPAAVAKPAPVIAAASVPARIPGAREERAVLISPIRRRIAERLVEAQQQAALLTTFNEVDMSAVMALRNKFKDAFLQRYGVKLGFMSFFVRAAVEALRAVPQVNAEFRDPHIVYRDYADIGIAVGGGKGLVVPVLRNAETLSFAQIELGIADFAKRAADNKLKLDELQGGTFTISNGGVYGSMMSTPIINPPQSGILGLHAITDRPVAIDGQVVIRPMMYLALTYDHRLVDGREAVTFLKKIKDTIEDPTRLILEV